MTPTPGTLTLAEVRASHAEMARRFHRDYWTTTEIERAYLLSKLDAAVKALEPFSKAFKRYAEDGWKADSTIDEIELLSVSELHKAYETLSEIGAE